MWPERTAPAWISCASWAPTSDFFSTSIIRSIGLCREIKKCAVWQTSDKVSEARGFCVCDTAQYLFGLGKGTHVLYSTSNKRSALCDLNDTFHTNAFSDRLSFLQGTHRPAQGCVARNTPPFILKPLCLPDFQFQHRLPSTQCLQGRV